MRRHQVPPERPLSIRIGRVVVRVALALLVYWGVSSLYRAYTSHARAQEIAPVHAYAQKVLIQLRAQKFFEVQEALSPALRRVVSIDRLAYFATHAELNATRGIVWGEWNSTRTPETVYRLHGSLVYTTGHKNAMVWTIQKHDNNMTIMDVRLGRRALVPKRPML